mmetsp:Transcript_6574/g.12386  ORF Transcript_6574/g.12386 Transcript_6574/m.12386 type:complete len:403 (+) Transcript_6574:142-1350(+)
MVDANDIPWRTTRPFAKLIACGHKHFLSLKSNLSFPAFLVQFNCKTENENISYYQWRSKRDFLILKRNQTRQEKVFPKSSLSKLSDEATLKPWVVPLTKDLVHEKDVILKKLGTAGFLDDDSPSSLGYYHPSMKKSIQRLEGYMNDCVDSDGWVEFSRREDSEGIIDFGSGETKEHSGDISKSAKFGQYFTIETNAQKIVEEAVAYYEEIRRNSDDIIVFVEPSCGDGRIIMQLSENLQSISAIDFVILACDLDNQLLNRCQENVSKLEHFNEGKIVLLHCDYLKTEPSCIFSHVHANGKQISGLIVVGNPPYSSGVGHGHLIERDLPNRFITHSVGLGAVFITFLLPQRYKRDIESIQHLIAQKTNKSWTCKCQELEDSRFNFGDEFFHQPSIIQCWYLSE